MLQLLAISLLKRQAKMKEFRIYTCGKMSGLTFSVQMQWRQLFEAFLKEAYDGADKIKFIHPPLYFNYENKLHKTEREILDWELMQLHKSDIVIVDFDGIDTTIGSHVELGAVQGINRFGDKYIYVVGVGDENNLHPWIKESCNRIESNYYDAARYVAEYLLV